RTCAEGLALRAEHDGAKVRVGVDIFERVGDGVDQRIVEEIVRRTLNLDGRDHTVIGDADIRVLLGHTGLLNRTRSFLRSLSVNRPAQGFGWRSPCDAPPTAPHTRA